MARLLVLRSLSLLVAAFAGQDAVVTMDLDASQRELLAVSNSTEGVTTTWPFPSSSAQEDANATTTVAASTPQAPVSAAPRCTAPLALLLQVTAATALAAGLACIV
mmetsp:Transcript_75734/g.201218  ORF Transcript_75734/g.201218 Transcript_75734/m.201218 type:complete len:106 (-) Transcript_75734:183-500(-)